MTSFFLDLLDISCPLCGCDKYSIYTRVKDILYKTADNEFRIVRCSNCSHVYQNPVVKENDLTKIYPIDYEPLYYERGLYTKVRDFIEDHGIVTFYRNLPKNARILDIGCGNGRLMRSARRFNPCFQITGLDKSKEVCHILSNEGFTMKCCDINHVELEKDFYDLAFMFYVLEHVHSPLDTLNRIYHSLKPGGYLIVEVPNIATLSHKIFRYDYWNAFDTPRHLQFFSPETFKKLCEKSHFIIVKVRYGINPLGWIQSVDHFLEFTGKRKIHKVFRFIQSNMITYLPMLVFFTIFDFTTSIIIPGIRLRMYLMKDADKSIG